MLLACEQPVSPVEVEIVFKPFFSAADVDVYSVTCRTARERLVRRWRPDGVILADVLAREPDYCVLRFMW